MCQETKFTIFCLESYKSYRKLSGKQAADLFEKYGVFDYVREFYDASSGVTVCSLPHSPTMSVHIDFWVAERFPKAR